MWVLRASPGCIDSPRVCSSRLPHTARPVLHAQRRTVDHTCTSRQTTTRRQQHAPKIARARCTWQQQSAHTLAPTKQKRMQGSHYQHVQASCRTIQARSRTKAHNVQRPIMQVTYTSALQPEGFTRTSSSKGASSIPTVPPTPWHANTSSVSSTRSTDLKGA